MVDSSTSVGDKNFDKVLEFLKTFLEGADINSGNVRVGVVTYSTRVKIQFHMNKFSSKEDIFNAIESITYIPGSTNTADAIQTMNIDMFTADNGDRRNVRNIAIILTDGVSNINSRRTLSEAEEAKKSGILIYALGIGLTETVELKGIASTPLDDYLYTVEDFSELDVLQENLFQSFCHGT